MSAARRRLAREERGFIVPITVVVLFIAMMFGIAAMSLSIGSLERVTEDRSYARALAAADAGADVAVWRMNKVIAPAESSGLVSATVGTVASFACLDVSVNGNKALNVLSGAGWCQVTSWETLDESTGVKQEMAYTMSTGINLSGDLAGLIERKIVATGRVGGVQRRVLLTMRIDPNLSTLALFRRYRYVECSGKQTGASPDSGCPS